MAFLEDENQNVEVVEEVVEQNVQEEQSAENVEKISKGNKKTKNKKPSKIKAAFSELKKVSWPGIRRVVKETAIVLSITAIFLVVIMGIDQLLYLLYNLLTKNM